MATESQEITQVIIEGQPDKKTRKYDRQLRLWAASGQSALENARILVISGTATSTSILKNLVLPGIGHFTILDNQLVTPQDAGINFFLNGLNSVGKSRAKEATRLLGELNEDVQVEADERSLEEVLGSEEGIKWVKAFTLVIAHNLDKTPLERLASLLWEDEAAARLVVVRSAGFLAEFHIQYKEHTIIESHSETTPSLRVDKAFPALLETSLSLDFENMDLTDHAHIPYVLILVRALEEWKQSHDGKPPSTPADRTAFKKHVFSLKRKSDEENFEEAESQAYRVWAPASASIPPAVRDLFTDPLNPSSDPLPGQQLLTPKHPLFFHLLNALRRFTKGEKGGVQGVLPLSSTLPDMKASTESYVQLQKLYKARSEEEKGVVRELVKETYGEGRELTKEEEGVLDSFVKNAHGLTVLRGKKWGAVDEDSAVLQGALQAGSKQLAIHLGLSALQSVQAKQITPLTDEILRAEALRLLSGSDSHTVLPVVELPDEWEYVVGELIRAPTADLPNTAAFLGGLVAQEVIKFITKQYIPIRGYCVADLVETWSGIL